MSDVKVQTRVHFAELTTTWVRDVFPNVVADKIERMEYATHPEVNARMEKEMNAWEDRSARLLMQQTLQEPLLTPRTAKAVTTQILKDPSIIHDLS